ncbi:MAG TPA: hypothetical protein VFY47_00045 [Thermoleophilaceae bacterium]|jgi:hypothetical protein|nr:hypothetical protein [Thermoleophilaceae bacterium]
MADTPRRIEVGFQGGQSLPVRVAQDVYDALRKALADSGSDRWFELTTEDSDVYVDLSQVVYVRLDTEDHRVGF